MATSTVYAALRLYLTEQWSACPVRWENETFDLPAPTNGDGDPATWLAVVLEGAAYRQASIGSGSPADERWIEEGSLLIYAIVETNAGTLAAREHATALAELFKGLTLPGDIRITGLSLGDGGPGDEDGVWWQLPVRIDWRRG